MIWPFARRRPAHDRVWGPLASAYLDHELTGAEAERFAAHLHECEACAALVAGYRGLDAGLKRRLLSAPAVPARPVFEAAERLGPRPAPSASPRRLVLASAAAMLIGGAAMPPVRAGVGGAVQYVREIVAPSSSISYAGERAVFRAGEGSVLVNAVRTYGLYTAGDASLAPVHAGELRVHGGPIFALAGGRILFNAALADGPARWTTVRADGSDPRPFFTETGGVTDPGGLVAVSATPDGSRVLFRRSNGAGAFLTTSGATIVADAAGNVVWQDPGGADVYSLSPDGRYALSGETGGVREIPLDGSAAPPAPISDCDVQRPQTSADGSALVFVAVRIGPECPAASALYYFRLNGLIGSPHLEPVPLQDGAVFSLSPNGRYVAVQSWLNQPAAGQSGSGMTALKLWDLASGERTELPGFRDVRITQLSWSGDGTRLLILDVREGHSEAWLSGVPGAAQRLLAGQEVAAAAFLTDGSGLALAGDGGAPTGLLAVDPPATGDRITNLLADGGGLTPAFASHGAAVALLQGGKPATLLIRAGSTPAALGRTVDGFSWAPNGGRAAVVVTGEVYLWDAHTGLGRSPLLAGRAVSWSPAGNHLLVTRADGSLVETDLRGGIVATAPAALDQVAWSPDGATVAGVERADGRAALILWTPSTGALQRLAGAAQLGAPHWSPDGRRLALATAGETPGTVQLDVLASDGGAAHSVATLASLDDSIVWSSDGAAVYYLARPAAGAPGALHRVSADGSGDRRIGQFVATAIFAGPR